MPSGVRASGPVLVATGSSRTAPICDVMHRCGGSVIPGRPVRLSCKVRRGGDDDLDCFGLGSLAYRRDRAKFVAEQPLPALFGGDLPQRHPSAASPRLTALDHDLRQKLRRPLSEGGSVGSINCIEDRVRLGLHPSRILIRYEFPAQLGGREASCQIEAAP